MIVLDASVLIALRDERDAHHERARAALHHAVTDGFGASPITVAEVLVAPARAGRLEQARTGLRKLELQEIPLGPDAAVRLAGLRADTGLRLPDCCVILAAEDASAEALVTFDDRLRAAAEGLGVRAGGG